MTAYQPEDRAARLCGGLHISKQMHTDAFVNALGSPRQG